MPLKTLRFQPGIRREGTSYSAEGGWYDSQWVRFRTGLPEKMGGYQRISSFTYQGVCRSLFPWVTLALVPYIGLGTNLKYYIVSGGEYYDITPIRRTVTLVNPFSTTMGSVVVSVHDVGHGAIDGDFVTFSGVSNPVGGITIDGEYQLTYVDADNYTIVGNTAATSTVSGGGGATVDTSYQLNVGPAIQVPQGGWGSSWWGSGGWGTGASADIPLQLWSASNFGEDLVFGPRGGGVYYWDSSSGFVGNPGVNISTLSGASGTPQIQNRILVSDIYRFVLLFGADSYAVPGTLNPMLIRWSDQESAANWTPSATSKAGELTLSRGSKIETAIQTRQEIVVFTDVAVYSLQYAGAPTYWGATLLADNISLMGPNAAITIGTTAYWMGQDKFYIYDGSVRTLPCDVRRTVFGNFNMEQSEQVSCGTLEAFNEIWWFYCSNGATTPDKYVVYNYLENIWYCGDISRTAWMDSSLFADPIGADPTNYNLVYHEVGSDDLSTETTASIPAYIESAQFDIDDGDFFAFVWRVMPDMTFEGSSASSPSGTLTIKAMKGSGSGYNSPASQGGSSTGSVARTATSPIEAYTNQVNIRVRGRQLVLRFESSDIGVTWQLGTPRIDWKKDGTGSNR